MIDLPSSAVRTTLPGAFDGTDDAAAAGVDRHRVRSAAVDLLDMGERLLLAVRPDAYGTRVAIAFNATIGGHYRHCLDHFASVLNGAGSGLIDYDQRARDPQVERDPEVARGMTASLRRALTDLDNRQLGAPVRVRCQVSYSAGDSPVTWSSLERELAYVVAHTIHHFALISVMSKVLGVTLPDSFGVAPSTLAHQRAVAVGG